MDTSWAIERLSQYTTTFAEIENPDIPSYLPDHIDFLNRRLPTVVRICKAVGLDEVDRREEHLSRESSMPNYSYWQFVQGCANQAIGVLQDWQEIESALRPEAPSLAADQFHGWVWESARPSWESGLFRAAVHHAASAVNEQLQRKLARADISDDKIVQEAFSDKPPTENSFRLKVPGDPSSQTTASRKRGAMQLGLAAFWFLRNPAAHNTDEWGRQEALESLALLSQFARIVDSSEVAKPPRPWDDS